MDPQISSLAPVLKSPWLMFHVAILMAAYGFFGISFLIGLTNLILMSLTPRKRMSTVIHSIRELSTVNEISLLVGTLLIAVGIFMGAVWANESWGRYWGWDPKETWALITLVVYVAVTHLHLVAKWYSLWLFNLCSVIAFASVLMTYFGVNYFLSGMHSYGQNDALQDIFIYLYAAVAIVTLLAVTARKKSTV
jgi:ABC-type transport system involved in cytochrome c biogenesis permease subunit